MATECNYATSERPPLPHSHGHPLPPTYNPPSTYAIGFTSLAISPQPAFNLLDVRAHIDLSQNPGRVLIDSRDTHVQYASCQWLEVLPNDRELQSGSVTIFSHPWGELQGDARWSQEVTFSKPYAARPNVVVWLSGFDLSAQGYRIKGEALRITPEGFTIGVQAWLGTTLRSATVSWIAHPADRPHIVSGEHETGAYAPKQGLTKQGRVDFGKTFQRPPRVWAALSELQGELPSLRIRLTPSNIDTSGMTWTWDLDSWGKPNPHGRLLHSARASYIAIQEF